MSFAIYFQQTCTKKLKENVALLLAQLSDPFSNIKLNVSGVLANAASGDLGSLGAYAKDYVKDNIGAIVTGAIGYLPGGVGATALNKMASGMDLVFNFMASATMAYNDMLLILMKYTAKECIKFLDDKEKFNKEIQSQLQQLYAAMQALAEGDPVFNQYLADLRDALVKLDGGVFDLRLVRNTLEASDTFLTIRFNQAKTKLEEAQKKIQPLQNNRYLNVSSEGAKRNLGIPTDKEKIDILMTVPLICRNLVDAVSSYSGATLSVNACMVAYFAMLDALKLTMPSVMKKYALRLFDEVIGNLSKVSDSMATVLNGDVAAKSGPVGGFEPVPLKVSGNSYKWARELASTLPVLRQIPVKGLTEFNGLSQGPVAAYLKSVQIIRSLSTVKTPKAILIQHEGQEDVFIFTPQILRLVTEANIGLATRGLAKSSLSVVKTMINRADLSSQSTATAKKALQDFINTPIPLEEELEKIQKSLMKIMRGLGLDAAADALLKGDIKRFFGMNSKDASYLGAALVTLGFLKQCVPSESETLTDAENELRGQQDLLNVSMSFNFDFAIFKNLEDCARLTAYVPLFLVKENLCRLVQSGLNSITSSGAYGLLQKGIAKVKSALSF